MPQETGDKSGAEYSANNEQLRLAANMLFDKTLFRNEQGQRVHWIVSRSVKFDILSGNLEVLLRFEDGTWLKLMQYED